MIKRVMIYSLVAALSVFNGIFSAKTFLIFALQGIWYPAFLPAPLTVMLFLSGVISTVLHLLITGIPAAMFEKYWLAYKNSTQSAFVWLAAMAWPTLITLQHVWVF
jgi:hypothetical protein